MVRKCSALSFVSAAFLFFLAPLNLSAGGLFKAPQDYASGASDADSVAVADVNGDSKLDLAVANACDGPGLSSAVQQARPVAEEL